MIERQTSAQKVNQVVNHPSVYPWVCGPVSGPLDLSQAIESGDYIALFGEHGGFLFWKVAPGIYDAHSAVLPEGRGRWALDAAREALRQMFASDAQEILMAVPKGNLAVRALVRVLKAQFRGTIDNGWWNEGRPIPADIYSLIKSDFEQCQLQPR